MKKQYIKFIEGDLQDLERACALAEKHGYKKRNVYSALKFTGLGLLLCGKDGDYYTSTDNEDALINLGYTEIKEEEENNVFIRGEIVLVRDRDEQKWEERIFLTTIDGAENPFTMVARDSEENFKKGKKFNISCWKQIKKLEKPTPRTIEATDEQWEEIKVILGL